MVCCGVTGVLVGDAGECDGHVRDTDFAGVHRAVGVHIEVDVAGDAGGEQFAEVVVDAVDAGGHGDRGDGVVAEGAALGADRVLAVDIDDAGVAFGDAVGAGLEVREPRSSRRRLWWR